MNYNGRAGCGLNGADGTIVNTSQTLSPHQVRQSNGYSDYVYDSHGNQTFADSSTSDSNDRTIRYSADDKAYEIFKGPGAAPNRMARFWYDPAGNRYKREDTGTGITGTRRTIYVGNLEIVSENGTTTYKRYIGGVLVQNVVNGIAANRYTFTDHLGSLVAIANESGSMIEGGGFNAYGERRANVSATSITQTGYSSTTRGYTGHEMLDGLDVIHMNGRIYDPTLGRFLQADPVIQAPANPQNWNAYSYVFNNPYKYTDPTGMLGQTERQWLAAVVMIVAAVAQQYWALSGWSAVGLYAGAGFVAGAIATKSLQGGLYGAFTAALTAGVGVYTQGMGGFGVFLQSVTGGIVESLQGGNFGAGFVTAWMGAAVMPGLAKIGNPVGRVIVSAIVGGTLSEATGGKFANGAVSWAVQGAMANREQINTVGSTGEGGLESATPADIASADAFLQNDSINAGQLFCNSNCPWKTPEAAHEAAGNRYLGASRVTRREVAWRVYKVDANSYSFTYGAISAVGAPSASFPAYLKTRGLIYDSSGHTHWDSNYQFSGQDWLFITQGRASGNGHTLYLATGDGSLQYAPPDLARNLARMQGARMIPYRDNFSGIRVNNVILKATYP